MIPKNLKSLFVIYLLTCGIGQASQAGKAYNDADKELNATYQKVLTVITDPVDKKLFIEAQKSWLRFRDAEVAFHAKYHPSSKGGVFVATDVTQNRVKELKVLLTENSRNEHEAPFGGNDKKDARQDAP